MSPSSRTMVKKKRMVNEGIEKGMNLKIRKELGVNLSNSFKDEREKTELQTAIENFFNQDDVSRVCPDTKKMVKNADDDEKVPIRYRPSSIDSIYEMFLSGSHLNCNVSYFK